MKASHCNRTVIAALLLGFLLGLAAVSLATEKIVYRGDILKKVFHLPSCSEYNCKACIEVLDSRQLAIKFGYSPCQICKP